MTIETLSYSARLKQRADVSAVIRLAASFLDLWGDNAAEGSDEERAELAKARAEFDAVRPLIEAAPDLAAMIDEIHEASDRDIYTDAPECADAIGRLQTAICDARKLIGSGRCISSQAVTMLQQIARMKTDSEIQDETDGEQCMEGDDAVSTVNGLIDQARGILSGEQS